MKVERKKASAGPDQQCCKQCCQIRIVVSVDGSRQNVTVDKECRSADDSYPGRQSIESIDKIKRVDGQHYDKDCDRDLGYLIIDVNPSHWHSFYTNTSRSNNASG